MTHPNRIPVALSSLLLAAHLLAPLAARAHGAAEPRHGGVVQTAADLSFELVGTPAGAALYVLDHDAAYDASKLAGRITVLNGARKSEAALRFVAGNRLEAAGVAFGPGAKAVVLVNGAGPTPLSMRFAAAK